MEQLNHRALMNAFPWSLYPTMQKNQEEALKIIAKCDESVTLELPTGTGKTAVGYTVLKAMEDEMDMGKRKKGPLFYIVHTKTLVEQVKRLHPDMAVAYGRNEHPCLYYPGEDLKADEIPCTLLVDCPHRVDQKTGETHTIGAAPCPYLQQKFEAKQSKMVVCTMAFYLFTQFFSREWDEPACLVIDEVHRFASVVRNALSYEITDWHLTQAIELLSEIQAHEARILDIFLKKMVAIIKSRKPYQATLLESHEIRELLDELAKIDTDELRAQIGRAVKSRKLDPKERREVLKKLETLTRDLRRYMSSLGYSLATGERHPLNYTYAFYKKELGEKERVQYRLVIRAYYVAPIIKKILSDFTVAYSATIGDPEILGFETGIKAPFHSLGSNFPAKNTRIFMPTNTPNLAMKERSRQDLTKSLRRIAKAAKKFARAGHRSLVVVISNAEREKFMMLAKEEGLDAVTYGNGVKPKDAALKFVEGEGDALVGTVANYGEGVDLPKKLAPVIFFLRPGYPSPFDPATLFEERRYGSMRWRIWNWRVMIEMMQIRGRNIRSARDLGVTFFISQQFRRFMPGVLPEWLQESYRGQLTFDESVKESMDLLEGR